LHEGSLSRALDLVCQQAQFVAKVYVQIGVVRRALGSVAQARLDVWQSFASMLHHISERESLGVILIEAILVRVFVPLRA